MRTIKGDVKITAKPKREHIRSYGKNYDSDWYEVVLQDQLGTLP